MAGAIKDKTRCVIFIAGVFFLLRLARVRVGD